MTRRLSRILVTGGAGFIGSHLVDALLKDNFEVTVIDNLRSGRMENLAPSQSNMNFHFLEGDIRDQHTVSEVMKDVNVVFHEAALVGVPDSVREPLLTNEINVSGTLNLLKAATDSGVNRFVFASSAAVYGGTSDREKREDDVSHPSSPYGISKLVGEYYARFFYEFYGLETVCLRYFNVYGPRQTYDLQAQYGGVITLFLNRLLKDMSPIIYGDGKQTRDFLYVKDVVKANLLAMTRKEAAGESFNIAANERISINKLAELLKSAVNKREIKNVYANPRPGDAKHVYADTSKAKRILNFFPSFSFEEGIDELVKWCAKN